MGNQGWAKHTGCSDTHLSSALSLLSRFSGRGAKMPMGMSNLRLSPESVAKGKTCLGALAVALSAVNETACRTKSRALSAYLPRDLPT